jgi:hypothetical protein
MPLIQLAGSLQSSSPEPVDPPLALAISLPDFQQQIEREFVQGSAISPALFKATVEIVPDLIERPGGEVETPLHDVLNWRYIRFGHQSRTMLYGAILRNEDGSSWQVKLSHPLLDKRKGNGRIRKYETPKGNGSKAFLPSLDTKTRHAIAQRYGILLPGSEGSVWDWIARHPQIPIILTEGGKKALSLLSQGYVAIALYGVTGGYCKTFEGTRHLIEDLAPFVGSNRPILLAFDQDEKADTRRRVTTALFRFGALLEAAGAAVSVITWNGRDGKGVDDLIVGAGAAAWELAYQSALPLAHWRIQQRLVGRLTWTPTLSLNTADLSALDSTYLPATGIVAIVSPKGTGKTKLMSQQIEGSEKILVGGHRIALMRQLAQRLNCHYLGDVDKAQGRFIAGGAYTLRLSFCVDSLLAIDPAHFSDCDLVIDECTQVIRHLLTSATCTKDGKRPALLAHLRVLLQTARRVIVADADLDNATLHYLKELRGDNSPIFLLRNDYQPSGYAVRFIESVERSPVIADLLKDVAQLHFSEALYIATDSKALTKLIARLIAQQSPDVELLVLNSETIGGEAESCFNRTPDLWLADAMQRPRPLVVIASPTLATGTSIETQGCFQSVWGIFMGVSSTDGDMTQALGRVREPVQRIVWCAQRGNSYSRLGRSPNAMELKRLLLDKTSATVRLIRSSLREDIVSGITAYDWQSDPHLNLYCQIEADRNRSMQELRTALLVRLRFEGNQVTLETRDKDEVMRSVLNTTRAELRELDAEVILSAPILSITQVLELETQEVISPEDRAALERFQLCDFYSILPETLTLELVLDDRGSRLRTEIRALEELLHPGVAVDRTIRALERQAVWNKGFCTWDIHSAELQRRLRDILQLQDFVADPERRWAAEDIHPYAAHIRRLAPQVKALFNFTPSDKLSDTQVVNQLLSQMGLRFEIHFSNHLPGHEGQKTRYYQLDLERLQFLQDVLERRATRRAARASEFGAEDEKDGSPLVLNSENQVGDPCPAMPRRPGVTVVPPQLEVFSMDDEPSLQILSGSSPPFGDWSLD